jgi:hypothetical protein
MNHFSDGIIFFALTQLPSVWNGIEQDKRLCYFFSGAARAMTLLLDSGILNSPCCLTLFPDQRRK